MALTVTNMTTKVFKHEEARSAPAGIESYEKDSAMSPIKKTLLACFTPTIEALAKSVWIGPTDLKKASSELYKWLKTQEAGGTVTSSGEFTLEQSKAWEKLGAFQLPFAEAWVLKVVQAAMSHPSCELQVQQTREETIFTLSGVQNWTRSLLEKSIFDLSEATTRDLGHLAVGVRALAQMKVRPFSIQYPDGDHVAWTGKGFTELPQEATQVSGLTLMVANFEFGQSRSFFSLDNIHALNLRADIVKVLADYCHLAKQVFTIDGREVTSHLHDPQFGITDKSRPLAFLRCAPNSDLPTLVIAESEEWEPVELGQHTVSLDPEVLSDLSQGQECSAAALLCAFVKRRRMRKNVEYFEGTEGQSGMIWVSDGVVVLREPLPVEQVVGVGVVVSADGLQTDLTGLQPRKDAEFKRRRAAALKLVQQQLEELVRLEVDGVDLTYSHMKSYLVGAAGAVCMFFVPMFGLALLSKAGYEYTSADRRTEYLDVAFDEGLKRVTRSLGRLAARG